MDQIFNETIRYDGFDLAKYVKENGRELSTIQQREKLNHVFSVDEKGPGGAHHVYSINGTVRGKDYTVQNIIFQNGPRNSYDSVSGVLDCDLLEIVRDRLKSFQSGEFATEYNTHALFHIEEALMWMNKRVEDRIERNVLGTYEK